MPETKEASPLAENFKSLHELMNQPAWRINKEQLEARIEKVAHLLANDSEPIPVDVFEHGFEEVSRRGMLWLWLVNIDKETGGL